MLSNSVSVSPRLPLAARACAPQAAASLARPDARQRIAEVLGLLASELEPQRRIVRTGELIFQAGERFEQLHVLNAGIAKLVSQAADGREQMVGLKFRGDWLGFGAIARGQHLCDAVAMDTAEVWSFSYAELLLACTRNAELLAALHEAMSGEITRDHASLMSVCTLSADARVADFLRFWADSLARRGLRTDQISLRMTRAEIGNYLGMTLETVSRALSKLARADLIRFSEKGRRDIGIPDVDGLDRFIQHGLAPATLQ